MNKPFWRRWITIAQNMSVRLALLNKGFSVRSSALASEIL